MKLCYFNGYRLGVVDGDFVLDVTPALDQVPAPMRGTHGDQMIANLGSLAYEICRVTGGAAAHRIADVRFNPPVAYPGKIFAAPVNYLAHQQEAEADPTTFVAAQVKRVGEIGPFLKASSSLVGTSEGVTLRHLNRRTDHEVELVAIIGKSGFDIALEDALDHVAAYTIGLDMTLRGPEERSLRKSIDSYTVLGPWLVTADEFGDPSDVGMSLAVNGEVRQNSRTSKLLLSVRELIVLASRFYTLHPGDVLMTGTPEGVGPVLQGDVMTLFIERIGTVDVAVR